MHTFWILVISYSCILFGRSNFCAMYKRKLATYGGSATVIFVILLTTGQLIRHLTRPKHTERQKCDDLCGGELDDNQYLTSDSKVANAKVTIGTFEGLNWTFFETGENRFAHMPHDAFKDLQAIVDGMEPLPERKSQFSIGQLFEAERLREDQSSLDKFHMEIGQYEMYPKDSKYVEQVLYEMATEPIQFAEQKDGGTQFKMTMTFANQIKALFKPMRNERHEDSLPNQLYFAEFERHVAEIAAFHLDRLLGFRKAMPVTGRKINLITDVLRLAERSLQETFFVSPQPDENICFTGQCSLYCDQLHPICGKGHTIEGSFTAFYPMFDGSDVIAKRHPWSKSYSEKAVDLAEWEMNPNFCYTVQETNRANGILLYEMIDMAIFDFMIGNTDRHHYGQFKPFGTDTFVVRYDHGRSFGHAFHDDLSIAAPFLQCCMIRGTTLKSLLSLHNGEKPLSALMEESLSADPVTPLLWQPHLDALDRRLAIVLHAVRHCIERTSVEEVIVWDV